MKKLFMIMVAASLVSASAFAANKNTSWDALRADRDLSIEQPLFASSFGPEGLFNACVSGDNFLSIAPVKVCVQYKEVPAPDLGALPSPECVKSELRDIVVSRTQTVKVCADYDRGNEFTPPSCRRYVEQAVTHSTVQALNVWRIAPYAEYLFAKSYEIPACN